MQGIKIVDHKHRLHVIARLGRPSGKLGSSKAAVALTHRLGDDQALGRGAQLKINNIHAQLCRRLDLALAANARKRGAGALICTGKPTRKSQIHRWHTRIDRLVEGSLKSELRRLRGHWLCTMAHGLVKIVCRDALIHIVHARQAIVAFDGLGIGKIEHAQARAFAVTPRKLAA